MSKAKPKQNKRTCHRCGGRSWRTVMTKTARGWQHRNRERCLRNLVDD